MTVPLVFFPLAEASQENGTSQSMKKDVGGMGKGNRRPTLISDNLGVFLKG